MNKRFIVVGVLLLTVLGLSHRGDAQSLSQLAWDPATDNLWTVPEYRVYINGTLHEKTIATTSWVPVEPGQTVSLAVSSYGWRLDQNLSMVWAEGPTSAPISYTKPGTPLPPPPPSELCGAEGYGDQIDNDGDGLVDEGCALPPPERCGADGYGNGVDEDRDGQMDEGCLVIPPPVVVKQCVTNGLPYPVDALLPPYTAKQGQVDAYVLARQREGWIVFTKSKVRSLSTVQMICKGL